MSPILLPVGYHGVVRLDFYGRGRVQLTILSPSTFDNEGGYTPAESASAQLSAEQAANLLKALQTAIDYTPTPED